MAGGHLCVPGTVHSTSTFVILSNPQDVLSLFCKLKTVHSCPTVKLWDSLRLTSSAVGRCARPHIAAPGDGGSDGEAAAEN